MEAGVLRMYGNLRSIQLTLEQHRFELQGPTHMHSFLIQQVHTMVLHNPQLVEFIDGKPWIQKASCTYMWISYCAGAGLAPPNLHVVDGSPVIAQGRLSRQKVQHDQNPGGLNQKL